MKGMRKLLVGLAIAVAAVGCGSKEVVIEQPEMTPEQRQAMEQMQQMMRHQQEMMRNMMPPGGPGQQAPPQAPAQ